MKISIAPAACPGKFPQGVVGALKNFLKGKKKEVRQGEMQMATPAAYSSNCINVPEGVAMSSLSIGAASIPSEG